MVSSEGRYPELTERLVVIGFIVGAMLLDLASRGPVLIVDVWFSRFTLIKGSAWWQVASVADYIGLRALTAPCLALLALGLSWRVRSWRPLWCAGWAILLVNLVVGVMKLAVGRGHPVDGVPDDLFAGGIMWPSGHAANIAMTTTLAIHLLRVYG
ncbi:MAG: hypothetical protein ACFCVK_04220 [Acidimicrobiales bacterium]